MGLFDAMEEAESIPSEGGIRGLTGEMAEIANAAIADGKPRSMPLNKETDEAVKVIKRYLSQEGWGCNVRKVNNRIYWQVREKREISEEQKAKMLAGLDRARKAKEAAKAAASNSGAAPAAKKEPAKPERAPASK